MRILTVHLGCQLLFIRIEYWRVLYQSSFLYCFQGDKHGNSFFEFHSIQREMCQSIFQKRNYEKGGNKSLKEFANDIRQTCKLKIQVWESTFLVSRILCRYSRQKREKNSGICKESVTRRYYSRPTDN